MTTRLLIAYGVIGLVLVTFALIAARAIIRRRRPRASRERLRVDLFATRHSEKEETRS